MFFSTRKELKSRGVYASSVYKQGSSFKNCGVCIKRLSTRKEFKSFGVYASCVYQEGSSLKIVVSASCVCQLGRNLKVVVSMHHVFINKEAV